MKTKPLKTEFKSTIRAVRHLFGEAICTGALIVIASSGQAQNLFVGITAGVGYIYEFTPNGTQSTFASGLVPVVLAFNSAGNLFEADFTSGNIYEFTPDGTRSTFASGLNYPDALAFNSAGNLFEADAGSGNIYEFTPNGTRSTFASGLNSPQALAFNRAGDLFEGDAHSGNIYEFTPNGTRSTFASGLDAPVGLAFDSAGNLFESDWGSGNIYEFKPDGTRSTFASGLSYPTELAFNSAGDLFEADSGSGNVYEFTPNGTRSTFASPGPGGPFGLAFQGVTLPVGEPPALSFNAFVNAVSISTNRAGNLVYRRFGNQDLIQRCASQMGITNLTGLHLVYDLKAEALEVVSGSGTNQTLICAPLTFSDGVFLGNANATKSERQAWVYWDGQPTPSGTLTAIESYGYGISNQLTRFSLSGQLQFALPGGGTNEPTIYQGSVVAGSKSFIPAEPGRK